MTAIATLTSVQSSTDREPPAPGRRGFRRHYLRALTWAFTFFGTVRVLTYLPTIHAIHASGDSSQHSLWTWLMWAGANLTMAAWLYEANGQRFDRAIGVNLANSAMCLLTTAVIVWHRI
ncbi:MAG: hypothetical protein U1F10_12035 [Burkholderiales bacterium]